MTTYLVAPMVEAHAPMVTYNVIQEPTTHNHHQYHHVHQHQHQQQQQQQQLHYQQQQQHEIPSYPIVDQSRNHNPIDEEIMELNNHGCVLLASQDYEQAHATLTKALSKCKQQQALQMQQQSVPMPSSTSIAIDHTSTSTSLPSKNSSHCISTEVDYTYLNMFLSQFKERQTPQGYSEPYLAFFQIPLLASRRYNAGQQHHCSKLSFVTIYNLALCFHVIAVDRIHKIKHQDQHQVHMQSLKLLRKALHLYEIAHEFYKTNEDASTMATELSVESLMDVSMLLYNIAMVHRMLGDFIRADQCEQQLYLISVVWMNDSNNNVGGMIVGGDDDYLDDVDEDEYQHEVDEEVLLRVFRIVQYMILRGQQQQDGSRNMRCKEMLIATAA